MCFNSPSVYVKTVRQQPNQSKTDSPSFFIILIYNLSIDNLQRLIESYISLQYLSMKRDYFIVQYVSGKTVKCGIIAQNIEQTTIIFVFFRFTILNANQSAGKIAF